MAGGGEEDEEEGGTVDAWSVDDVCEDDERDDEERGCVGGNEEEWKPARVKELAVCFHLRASSLKV